MATSFCWKWVHTHLLIKPFKWIERLFRRTPVEEDAGPAARGDPPTPLSPTEIEVEMARANAAQEVDRHVGAGDSASTPTESKSGDGSAGSTSRDRDLESSTAASADADADADAAGDCQGASKPDWGEKEARGGARGEGEGGGGEGRAEAPVMGDSPSGRWVGSGTNPALAAPTSAPAPVAESVPTSPVPSVRAKPSSPSSPVNVVDSGGVGVGDSGGSGARGAATPQESSGGMWRPGEAPTSTAGESPAEVEAEITEVQSPARGEVEAAVSTPPRAPPQTLSSLRKVLDMVCPFQLQSAAIVFLCVIALIAPGMLVWRRTSERSATQEQEMQALREGHTRAQGQVALLKKSKAASEGEAAGEAKARKGEIDAIAVELRRTRERLSEAQIMTGSANDARAHETRELKDARLEVEAATQQIRRLEERLARAAAVKQQLAMRYREAQGAVTAGKAELAGVKERLKGEREAGKQKEQRGANELGEAKAETAAARAETEDLREKVRELEANLKDLNASFCTQGNELRAKTAEVDKVIKDAKSSSRSQDELLKKREGELTQATEALAFKEDERSALELRLRKLEAENASKEEKIHALTSLWNEAASHVTEPEAASPQSLPGDYGNISGAPAALKLDKAREAAAPAAAAGVTDVGVTDGKSNAASGAGIAEAEESSPGDYGNTSKAPADDVAAAAANDAAVNEGKEAAGSPTGARSAVYIAAVETSSPPVSALCKSASVSAKGGVAGGGGGAAAAAAPSFSLSSNPPPPTESIRTPPPRTMGSSSHGQGSAAGPKLGGAKSAAHGKGARAQGKEEGGNQSRFRACQGSNVLGIFQQCGGSAGQARTRGAGLVPGGGDDGGGKGGGGGPVQGRGTRDGQAKGGGRGGGGRVQGWGSRGDRGGGASGGGCGRRGDGGLSQGRRGGGAGFESNGAPATSSRTTRTGGSGKGESRGGNGQQQAPLQQQGFANPENTLCSVNSVLQLLRNDPSFRGKLRDSSIDDATPIAWSLQSLFQSVDNGKFPPADELLNRLPGVDQGGERGQSDATEVLGAVLDGLKEEARGKPALRQLGTALNHMSWEIRHTAVCSACQEEVHRYPSSSGEVFHVPMTITGRQPGAEETPTTGDDLAAHLTSNVFASEDAPASTVCIKCLGSADPQGSAPVLRHSQLVSCPSTLFVALRREYFCRETGRTKKIHDKVGIPLELDMNRFTTNESAPAVYRLEGVVHHAGGTQRGHYKTFLRSPDDKWICFNDHKVEQSVAEKNVLNGHVQIMRYAKR